jgi:hypothetical protein
MFSLSTTPRTAPASWRKTVRRAVDRTVAFATLESVTSARDLWSPPVDGPGSGPHGAFGGPAPHPHRAPLRAPVRPGRAGTVPARDHHCLVSSAGRPRHRSAHPSAR